MSQSSQVRTYDPAASIVFLKTNERFGGLSNMAPGFPLRVNEVRIRTSEALYQACRFPHMPDVQRKIIDEHSPMTAKMRSKPFRKDSRPDWDAVRVKVMRWCLRVKLAQNWDTFRRLLLDTGDRPIVEQSRKDDFWGAKVGDDEKLVGMNVLGRLLMELREEIKSNIRNRSTVVLPLEISNFFLFGQPVDPVGFGSNESGARSQEDGPHGDLRQRRSLIEATQSSFFEPLQEAVVSRVAEDTTPDDGLRPYPEMKPSGLPWLGEVPSHWDVRRNGRLFASRRETGFPDLPVLEVSLRSGVRVRDFDNGVRKQQIGDRSKYQRAKRGDIAYNMMRTWQGAIGIAPVDGLVSPAYVVARPFVHVDAAYYAYLFRTAAYMREIDTFSRGIVPDRNRLYWESFKQMPSVYPPIDEQRLIVRFLDWHGEQVAKLIRAKKKTIVLLNEQKRAIVHRAVTRGLEPTVKLKPSGIPGLGDIPEAWEVKRLRNVAELRVSNIDKKSVDDEQPVRLCNYVDVYKNDIIHGQLPFMNATASEAEIKKFRLRIGDVIITKDSEDWKDIGVPALVQIEAADLVCAYHLALLRPITSQADGAFLFWSLLSPDVRWQFAIAANGVTRYGLSQGSIKELVLAVPDVAEQRAIAAHLDATTTSIRSAERDIQSEIDLIQEFRTCLIADVVSGKLDVRVLASTLPEVSGDHPHGETSDIEEFDELDTEDEEVAA